MLGATDTIDLHIHTIASDGCWTPQEVVGQIRKAGIKVFSITDHDTTASIDETSRLTEGENLIFIPGVEISSTFEGKLYHILGYGIDPHNVELQNLLLENTRLMIKKDDDTIHMLMEEGHILDFSEYLSYEYDAGRGGWKTLNFLIDKGLCRDAGDFFNRLFTGNSKIPFPTFSLPRKVISLIQGAGGVAVLAHPGGSLDSKNNLSFSELEKVLEGFHGSGIDGIECYHPAHDSEMTEFYLKWATGKGLLVTGGSDCHGDFIPTRQLGGQGLTVETLGYQSIKRIISKR